MRYTFFLEPKQDEDIVSFRSKKHFYDFINYNRR